MKGEAAVVVVALLVTMRVEEVDAIDVRIMLTETNFLARIVGRISTPANIVRDIIGKPARFNFVNTAETEKSSNNI